MKKLTLFSLIFLVLLPLLFGGVTALGTGSTVAGMQAVVKEAPGSFAMQDPAKTLVLMAWPVKSNYGIAVLNQANGAPVENFLKIACNGTACDVYDLSGLVKKLESLGWERVAPSTLPASITSRLVGWQAWVSVFRPGMINILVIPAVSPYNPFETTNG